MPQKASIGTPTLAAKASILARTTAARLPSIAPFTPPWLLKMTILSPRAWIARSAGATASDQGAQIREAQTAYPEMPLLVF